MSPVSQGKTSFDVSITIETNPSPAYEGSAGSFSIGVKNAGPGNSPSKFAFTNAIPIGDDGAYVLLSETESVSADGLPFDQCTLITGQSRGNSVAFGFYIPELEAKQTLTCQYAFEVLSGLDPPFELSVSLEHRDDTNSSNNRMDVAFGGFEPVPIPTLDFVGVVSMAILILGASWLARLRMS